MIKSDEHTTCPYTELNKDCRHENELWEYGQEIGQLHGALDDCMAENAKLRKVAEAARGVFLGEGEHLCSEFEDAMDMLEQAIAELDKEGER